MILDAADRRRLESSTLFRWSGIETIAHLLESCETDTLESGAKLLEPGVVNNTLYVILEGELRVYLSGHDMPAHAVLGPGECVGEMSLIDGQVASALVIAATDTRVLAMPHETLWALVDSSHGIARNLLGILSGRMRSNNLTLVAAQTRSLEFEQAGSVDALTGLHNRAWLKDTFPRALQRCDRDGISACLVFADIDHLSRFNERFGHLVGDAALRRVVQQLADGLRSQDLIARYGGEEFLILLPRTDLDEGMLIAERLRELVASGGSGGAEPADGIPPLTVSCGVATHVRGEALEAVILRAERALRSAKENGRDRVETA